jgi:hypothetical protein
MTTAQHLEGSEPMVADRLTHGLPDRPGNPVAETGQKPAAQEEEDLPIPSLGR